MEAKCLQLESVFKLNLVVCSWLSLGNQSRQLNKCSHLGPIVIGPPNAKLLVKEGSLTCHTPFNNNVFQSDIKSDDPRAFWQLPFHSYHDTGTDILHVHPAVVAP
jgi:hypothetical protein